jgi:hypothetical protein
MTVNETNLQIFPNHQRRFSDSIKSTKIDINQNHFDIISPL